MAQMFFTEPSSPQRMTRKDQKKGLLPLRIMMIPTAVWVMVLASFVLGYFLGSTVGNQHATPDTTIPNLRSRSTSSNASASFVIQLDQIPTETTSHAGIDKQVLLPSFRIAPNLAALSVASINPGQRIDVHHHPTMYEFFYVLSGRGSVAITAAADTAAAANGSAIGNNKNKNDARKVSVLKEGSFLQTAPGDFHEFWVDADDKEPLRMIYFGVTTN